MWFASNGYVCLVVDTLQLGEIGATHHGTYNLDRFWWHSRGYTPAGVECWNGIRGIDYLVSRPEVDPEKIGVTGISGGGAAIGLILGNPFVTAFMLLEFSAMGAMPSIVLVPAFVALGIVLSTARRTFSSTVIHGRRE